jgi:hypothetical protein
MIHCCFDVGWEAFAPHRATLVCESMNEGCLTLKYTFILISQLVGWPSDKSQDKSQWRYFNITLRERGHVKHPTTTDWSDKQSQQMLQFAQQDR